MADTTHHSLVRWTPHKRDLRAHHITVGAQLLDGSASSHVGGDPGRADPEELFVASLSACHMLWFLDFARRERLRVASYEDEAEGTMDGVRMTRVALRPRILWEGEAPADETVADLHHRAHEACFIANSVTCPVEVETPLEAP